MLSSCIVLLLLLLVMHVTFAMQATCSFEATLGLGWWWSSCTG
jgi:hypothetical protein